MRKLTLALIALLLCLATPGRPSVADTPVHTDTVRGFKIDRPAGWTFSEPAAPDGVGYAMKLAKVKDGTETSLTIYVAERPETISNSTDARNAIETKWKENEKISNVKRGKSKCAGAETQWLKCAYDAGAPYTLRQHFLIRDDELFILQCLAPEKEFGAAEKDFDALLDSFDFVPIDKDRGRLLELAAKCGSEVKFAESWQEAAQRAKDEGKLVMVVFEVYRGLLNSRFTLTSVFMHPDMVELVNARFVPMFWTHDSKAPFNHPSVFGLGPSTFGSGLMIASHDGKIVGQAVTGHPFHLYDFCREVLAEHPGAKPANEADPLEALRRGELERAQTLLADPVTGPEWRAQADLQRRLRDGAKAQAAIEKADAEGEGSLDNLRALVFLNRGEAAQAAKATAKAKDPEGKFWNCCARASQKDFAAVEKDLRELALENPESRWGWWAASIVMEPRLRGVLGMFEWPDEQQFNAWRLPKYELEPDVSAARESALQFLIDSQNEDGRWVNPRTANGMIFDVATATICAASLIGRKDSEPAQLACGRTLDYVLEQELLADPSALFDYTIWAQIFSLDFMARCNDAEIGNRRKNLKAMNAIIKDMEANQYDSGGWGYFHHESDTNNSIGFVTAAAVLALHRAEKAGAEVSKRMLSRACESIEYLKHPSGSYGYMWMSGPGDEAKQAEASLRSPLYALALKRRSRLDISEVRGALDVYLKHHEHTIAERGKSVCHTGPEGTAAYYLLFGYRFAAEAMGELPAKDRNKYSDALTHDVLQFRLADGSFCDYRSVGREYGAAMALTALDLLAE